MTRTRAWSAALGVVLVVGVGCGSGELEPAEGTTEAPAPTCEADGVLQYVCGPVNAEDIVQLGDSRWLVVSGMNGQLAGTDVNGHIYLVDHEAKTYEEWFPGASPMFAADAEIFADCPGPLDPSDFSAHGLALRAQAPGRYRLYMTSHGAREAIEAFEVDASGDRPSITWVGCVPLPDGTFANSVAILSDGGFVTTNGRLRTVERSQ